MTQASRTSAVLAVLILVAALLAGGTSTGAGAGARAPAEVPAPPDDELEEFLPEAGGSPTNETDCSISCVLSSCSIQCTNASAICRCDIVSLVILGGSSNGFGQAECRCVSST